MDYIRQVLAAQHKQFILKHFDDVNDAGDACHCDIQHHYAEYHSDDAKWLNSKHNYWIILSTTIE